MTFSVWSSLINTKTEACSEFLDTRLRGYDGFHIVHPVWFKKGTRSVFLESPSERDGRQEVNFVVFFDSHSCGVQAMIHYGK